MKLMLRFIPAIACAIACAPRVDPAPPRPPPEATPRAACENFCSLGCSECDPQCVAVVERLLADRILLFSPACVASAQTRADVRLCPVVDCL